MTLPGYDAWRLAGPREEHTIGKRVDDECGRFLEQDEDQPRRYCPKPCGGMMICEDGVVICDTCGELAQ